MAEGLTKQLIEWLASGAWKQLGYLCNYESYVEDFENKKGDLLAELQTVEQKIEDAKKRNKTQVEPRVAKWLASAKNLSKEDAEPTKCFGLCTNCFSQIERAKVLENLTKETIPNLITKVKDLLSEEVARAAGVSSMEFHSQEFMPFESRKPKFEELKKELEDDNNYMIGLQGMGGTGKSIMAKEVWKHVQKSNAFDRVIFIKVSTPLDEKRIRDDIVKELELQLEEEKILSHAQQIWIRIVHAGKVLIILDDVWEELDLKNIGIPHGIHSKDRCCVLLTTRSMDVCISMECQKTVQLHVLPMEDALNLFLYHSTTSRNDFPDDLKSLAQDIVSECGGLPVMIEAVAKAFKRWSPQQWQSAFIAFKNPMPLRHGMVDEQKRKIYNSLRFSYDHLKDKNAQVLFLLCSIFPKAYEIPLELLSRIVIGLGLFGEDYKYFISRSYVHGIENTLINSSLLLKAGEGYVKMHDLIREVALEIANDEIQVIMDSKTDLKGNLRYSSWIINGFPNCFDDRKLQILLVWIDANGSLEVPNTTFGGMESLRVLIMHSKIEFGRTSAVSLPKSIQSLKEVRTLSLKNWELGDISVVMRNLQKLESLELINCSIIELPNEISELDKLRFLCLKHCSLEKNNPFEVIARCSQLEELYYVSNDDHIPIGAKVPQIASLPEYQIYHIDGSNFSTFNYSQLDTPSKRIFKPGKLQKIFSNDIIISMATRAETLELTGDNVLRCANLIPSIISIEDRVTEDLIRLSLKSWPEMNCLVYADHPQFESGVAIFSKLAELQLDEVNARELCYGRYPHGFLMQLEKLVLKKCQKLESTLFQGNLELGNLKYIVIEDCSMTCLFHPSTAQSLGLLETLEIDGCSQLEYIIRDEGSTVEEQLDGKDPNTRSHGSMFPKLKLLRVTKCRALKFIMPVCFCEDLPLLDSVHISSCINLKYMFGQYPEEGGLHQIQKETTLLSLKIMFIQEVPLDFNIYAECYLPQKLAANTSEGSKEKDKSPSHNVSWDPFCYFLPKSKTTNKDESSVCKASHLDYTSSQEKYVVNTAHGIFTPPLYPCNLREMDIKFVQELRSLFSVSIAKSMLVLEKLRVDYCFCLEHIVREEVDGDNHMNANSIFPNLRTIKITACNKLEYVFPASCSKQLEKLESVHISIAIPLKYVFASSYGDDISLPENHSTEIHLPALNQLNLYDVPNMVSMCPKNYLVKAPSLKDITLNKCPQLPINSFIDLSVERHKGQDQFSRKKIMGMHLCGLEHLTSSLPRDMVTMYDLQRLQITNPVKSSLKTLILRGADIRNICVGPENLHLSFQNLVVLDFDGCHELKFIFFASISRSLPYLKKLKISHCDGLERIIEEDENDNDSHHHQGCCFPNLHNIYVMACTRLKCLFSITTTCYRLPQLSMLFILHSPELEQVFGRKEGAIQELDIKNVFPKLIAIQFDNLPRLHSICPAIDFHTVIYRHIERCPNLTLTSTDTDFIIGRCMEWLRESKSNESNNSNMDEEDLFDQLFNRAVKVAEKTKMRDPPIAEQSNGSANVKEIAEASGEESPESEEAIKDEVKDSEQTNKSPLFSDPSQIETAQDEIKVTQGEIFMP